jgi:hypothetical protein
VEGGDAAVVTLRAVVSGSFTYRLPVPADGCWLLIGRRCARRRSRPR